MAHADYECCAVCDSKVCYSNSANSKGVICSPCVANLAQSGVIVHDVQDLITWMEQEKPATVVSTLQGVGFGECLYANEVDEAFKAAQQSFAPDTASLRNTGEPRLEIAIKALEEIRNTQGKVCEIYEICGHVACQSSYASWAIADEALHFLTMGCSRTRQSMPR